VISKSQPCCDHAEYNTTGCQQCAAACTMSQQFSALTQLHAEYVLTKRDKQTASVHLFVVVWSEVEFCVPVVVWRVFVDVEDIM